MGSFLHCALDFAVSTLKKSTFRCADHVKWAIVLSERIFESCKILFPAPSGLEWHIGVSRNLQQYPDCWFWSFKRNIFLLQLHSSRPGRQGGCGAMPHLFNDTFLTSFAFCFKALNAYIFSLTPLFRSGILEGGLFNLFCNSLVLFALKY